MGLLFSLRKYREGDEQAIVELLKIAFRKAIYSLEYWDWKYKKNPAGFPVIWLAEHGSKIIGHYSIIPIRMKLGNSYIIGSFSEYAATHPKYQGKGVFSAVVNRCYLDAAQNNIPLTYGFANVNLGPTYKRYERVGHICLMTDMVKVLNWEPLVGRYIHSKVLTHAAAEVLGKIRMNRSTFESVKIQRINSFDERIDTFWDEISEYFKIIVKRDQGYLNWRYVGHPTNKYTIFAAVKDDRILGYCVLSETHHKDLKLGLIVDILGFQEPYNAVSCLIQRAIKCFSEHNVDMVRCMMSEKHPYRAVFWKAGFFTDPRHRRAIHASINLRGSNIDEKAAYPQALMLSQNYFLKEKRNWFMMAGDGTDPHQIR